MNKRNRRAVDLIEDQRKISGGMSFLMNSVRPIQSEPEKYPGFYVFQESLFGNMILPAMPRAESNPK
ncbi:hypothetical protein D915_011064 [Fasciola hepatica]|uniref:Uncharacterized protein n=1 Tax=Fasciola hepatica TaxID=6192 RepID=A0A4E0QYS5_FASHE|nr:hypothetical protein D915_011064 [Fasciola hepatica]